MSNTFTWNLLSDAERSGDSVFILDSHSQIFRYVNDCACQKLGYSRDELLQMGMLDIDPFTYEVSFQKITEQIKTKGFYCIESYYRTKEGNLFPVEVNGYVFEYQSKVLEISIARDISERKHTESEMQRLIDILEESADFIGSADMQNQLLYHNRAAKRMVGLPEDADFSKMTIADMHPQWVLKLMQETAIPHVITHGVWRGEAAVLHRDGHEIPVSQTLVLHRNSKGSPEFMSTIMQDITEQKKHDEQLKLLEHAFNHVNDAIFLIDENARIVHVNEKACHSLGYSREELLQMQIFDFDTDFTPDDWVQFKIREWGKESFGTITIESRHKRKDGRIFPVEVYVNLINYQGKIFSLSIIRDISVRKKTENQLQLLNYALDHVKETVALIDENAKICYSNANGYQIRGYSHDEMLDLSVADVDPDFPLEHWSTHWQDLKTHGSLTFESRHKTKEGRIFPVEISANYFEFDGQSYNLGFVRDISERKETEKQLHLLNFAFDHINEGIWLMNENANTDYLNEAACRSLGYTREEALKLRVSDFDPDYPMEHWAKYWDELKTKGSLFFESRHKTKDGHIFPVEVNVSYFEFDGKGYNFAISRDISERKQTQEALQRSETLLSEAQRIAHIGSWEVDFSNGELLWTDENYRIWEIDKSQFGATVEAFYETVHPDDLEKVAKAYTESVANKTLYQIEHRLLFPDGRIKYIAERGEPFLDEKGNITRFVGTSMDITEQQRIKEILEFVAQRGWKDSGELFLHALAQYLAQIFDVDYVVIDKLGSLITQAETLALYVKGDIVPNMSYDLKGTPCDGVMNGKLCVHPSGVQQLFPDDLLLVEMQVESYAGLPLWNTTGEVIGLIAVMDTKPMKDISFITAILQLVATSVSAELERQRSEQALIDSHHFLKQIINTLADPVFVKDRQHRWVLLNQTFCDFIGYSLEELHGKSDYDFFPKEQADIFWEKDELVFSDCGENTNEETFTDASGNVRTIITKKTCYTDSKGQPFLVGIITDITERKRMEDELAAREQQFRVLAETLPSPVFRFDKDCRRIYVNPIAEKISGKTAAELLYKKASDSSPLNEDELKKVERVIEHVLKTGEPQEGEVLFKVPITEQIYYFHNNYAPEFDAHGKVTSVVLISHDITERKKMEEQLRQREQEFRILVESSPTPIARYDKNLRRIYVNPIVEKITGKTTAELLGVVPSGGSIVSKADGEELEQILRYVLKTGQPAENETKCILANGELHYFSSRYAAELDADGNPISVVLVSYDITERKKMENIIRLREQEFRVLVETSPAPIIRYDANCRRVYVNPAVEKISGKTAAELIDHAPVEGTLLDKPVKNKIERILRYVLKTGRTTAGEVELVFPDGQTHYFYNRYAPELNIDGKPVGVVLVGHDITAHKHAEKLLVQREREFRTLAENTHNLIVRYDRNCCRIYVNPAYAREVPNSLNQTPEQVWIAVNTTPSKYISILHRIMETGVSEDILLEGPKEDGQLASHIFTITPEFDAKGRVTGVLAIGHDITELKRGELRLQQREREFRSLAENMPDCVVRYDTQCRACFMNHAILSSVAPAALPIIGETLIQSHPDNEDAMQIHQFIEQIIKTGNDAEIEISMPHPSAGTRIHLIRGVAEYEYSGELVGVLAIGHDITERKQMEQQMFYHASYDSLTGLPNRRMLNNRMREEIAKAERSHQGIAVLFVDLDRFKEVNDTLGHEIGDCLLVEAAQRIRNCIRTSDTVARLGGDEFVVILSSVGDVPPLERVTQSIIVALAQPFYFGYEYSAYISASIGIAVYPQDAKDAESLIGCADQAMYAAKESGRNNFNFFTASMQEQAHQRLRLIGCLREALDKNQFEVYYQPITCVMSGKAIKAEALVRWHHPELGMVSPALFIPLAEETDLIQDIGSWVFRQAANTAKRWNELSGDDENRLISINMSPRQLTKGIGDQIAINYLREIELDSAHIVVEITEGLLLDNSSDIIEKLERLRMAGIQISLDDFGTGYSAMAYLKKFNLDYLKIDQSFVRGMETDLGDHAITEAIIMMAHRLGLKVIAEGVETEGQRKLLADAGCEYIQGYLYSKPLPLDAFLSYVLK